MLYDYRNWACNIKRPHSFLSKRTNSCHMVINFICKEEKQISYKSTFLFEFNKPAPSSSNLISSQFQGKLRMLLNPDDLPNIILSVGLNYDQQIYVDKDC